MKFSIKTLGCKINQFDSGALSEALISGGASPAADGEPSDVYIIQTCTVTKKSDYHCRQAIRRAVKEKPGHARVFVTGCYAETSPQELLDIPGVDMVVGNSLRNSLPAMILEREQEAGRGGFSPSVVRGRSRAFLKVQEGCDASCSYCIVPRARGRSRSAAAPDVVASAEALVARGYREIVLTGVHLGCYGKDLPGTTGLAGLLEQLLDMDGLGRLRLSSLEPMEFDSELLRVIAGHAIEGGRLCRHVHIPLQSADDAVLKSMGRGYTWDEYLAVAENIAASSPGACIGADVIVGYPAEDDNSFETTLGRIERSPINYLHVFSYSPRPGASAYPLGDPVPASVKKERGAALRAVAASKGLEFRRSLMGRRLDVVVEEKEGIASGLTDNYVRVRLDRPGPLQGSLAGVRILSASTKGCRGEVL